MAKRTAITALILMVTIAVGMRRPTARARAADAKTNIATRAAAKTKKSSAPAQPQTPSPSANRQTYGAYWTVGNGHTTALLLKNKDLQNATTANVTLFSAAGQQLQITQLQIPSGATKRLDLAEVLKLPSTAIAAGGLTINSTGEVSGQLMIEGPRNSFNLPLQGGYRYDSEDALYAPWWLPDVGSNGRLALFNSSGQPVTVTPSIVAGGSEQITTALTLAPYGSATLDLRQLIGTSRSLAGTSGMVILRYSGLAHALLPALWLTFPNTRSSLTAEFQALHQQPASSQVTWQYPQVSLTPEAVSETQPSSPLTAYALLSNGVRSSVTPELVAYYVPDGAKKPKKVSVTVASLAPLETRLLNLSQLLTSASMPAGVSQFGLTVTHNGSPGDLAMSVFSATPAHDLVLRSAGSTQPTGAIDVGYWQMGGRPVIPKVLNRNKAAAQAQVTMYYQTALGLESYLLPVMGVPGHKSQSLGLQGVMNAGMADAMGSKIPSGIKSGLVILTAVNTSGERTLPPENGPPCSKNCNTEEASPSPLPPTLLSGPSATAQGTATAPTLQFDSSLCPPIITEIDPSEGDIGTTVDVIIIGENFEDGDEVNVTGGIEADIPSVSPDGTVIETTFTIGNDATPGDQTVTVTGLGGESNGVTFTVNTPGPPILESVDPDNGIAGTQVKVLIDLAAKGPWRDGDTINVTGGISASVDSVSADGIQVNATFTIPICNSDGEQQVTISDVFGQTSDSATFTVNEPTTTPALTSVNPSTLQAGTTTTLTIQGTNLTQSCSLFVTSTDPNISFGPATFTDETGSAIKVDATVDANDPGGQFDLFVDFTFISGTAPIRRVPIVRSLSIGQGAVQKGKTTGALPSDSAKPKKAAPRKGAATPAPKFSNGGGGGTTNSLKITVTPIQATTPQILFLGTDLANNSNPKTVYIGQQIVLTAKISLSNPNLIIASETWSTSNNNLPPGIAIAGYDDQAGTQPPQPTPKGGFAETLQATVCNNSDPTTCPYNTFYWIDQGNNRQLTFTYQLANKQQASATVTFKVIGPTNPNITAVSGHTDFIDTRPVPTNHNIVVVKMRFAGPGMSFTLSASSPSPKSPGNAKYSFAQIISNNLYTIRDSRGLTNCLSNAVEDGPALDTFFPYPFAPSETTKSNDSPGVSMNLSPSPSANSAEVGRVFHAKMYLMWDPGLMASGQGGCTPAVSTSDNSGNYNTTPSTCTGSIPVPLGFVEWAFNHDGLNTKYGISPLQQSTQTKDTYQIGCSNCITNPKFQKSSEIPQWTTSFQLNQDVDNSTTCH